MPPATVSVSAPSDRTTSVRDRFLFVLINLLGKTVIVHLLDGTVLEGVLHTANIEGSKDAGNNDENGAAELVLKLVREIDAKTGAPKYVGKRVVYSSK